MVLAGVEARKRHIVLHGLDSQDLAFRERALNTIIREASSDPKLRTRVAGHLPELSSEAVLQVYQAMVLAGATEAPELRHAWLGQLDRLEFPHLIAIGHQLPGDGLAERKAVVKAALPHLDTVDSSEDYDRLVSLLDAHRAWSCPPVPVHHYVKWLDRWVTSQDAAIRRAAAFQLGNLPRGHGSIEPVYLHDRLVSLLDDPEPRVREAALLAIAGLVPRHPSIYLPDIENAQQDPAPQIASLASRLLAVWERSTTQPYEASVRPAPPENFFSGSWDDTDTLIAFESAAPASLDVKLDPAMPHLVRIAATRVSRDAEPQWLVDTLRLNDRSAVRDLACVVLANRFSREELSGLIDRLLKDHDPDARGSGAILVGLTGQGLELLQSAEQQETLVTTEYLMRLAQWMQNQRPELDTQLLGMLGRKGIPESTVMLAMLHRGLSHDVLDHLLSFGSPLALETSAHGNPSPLQWVWHDRWHQVLRRYLPAEAPLPPPDADPDEVAEHFKDLLAWHALSRHGSF
ncbi:hypothetical protein [Algisphaera agarilytica]